MTQTLVCWGLMKTPTEWREQMVANNSHTTQQNNIGLTKSQAVN